VNELSILTRRLKEVKKMSHLEFESVFILCQRDSKFYVCIKENVFTMRSYFLFATANIAMVTITNNVPKSASGDILQKLIEKLNENYKIGIVYSLIVKCASTDPRQLHRHTILVFSNSNRIKLMMRKWEETCIVCNIEWTTMSFNSIIYAT